MSVDRGTSVGPAHAAGAATTARGAAGGKHGAPATPGDFLALLAGLEDTQPATLAVVLDGDGQAQTLPQPTDAHAPGAQEAALVPPDAALAALLVPPAPTPLTVVAAAAAAPTQADAAAVATASAATGASAALAPVVAPGVAPAATGCRRGCRCRCRRLCLCLCLCLWQGAAARPCRAASHNAGRHACRHPPSRWRLPRSRRRRPRCWPRTMRACSKQLALKNRLAAQQEAQPTTAAVPALATSAAMPAAAVALAETRRDRLGALSAALLAPPAAAAGAGGAVSAEEAPVRATGRSEATAATVLAAPHWDFRPTVQHDQVLTPVQAPAPADPNQLADQVSYWAAQGLRGAELTLHGDTDPVQVSIALDGNQARVEFRSEHAATREWLAASTDQLRELLQREGVVLSGVSVGQQASQQQHQSGQAPPPAPSRPTGGSTRSVAATAPAAPAPRPRPAGTVDLFV